MHAESTVPDGFLEKAVAEFRKELRRAGLYSSLGYLNSRSIYRYTGIYLFEPPMLRCACLFDRENPAVHTMADLALRDSYCGIIGRFRETLIINDSLNDARLEGHSAREKAQSYYGIPLCDSVGACIGTLCHWDVRPRLTTMDEIGVLYAVAPDVSAEVVRERRGRLARKAATSPIPGGEGVEICLDDKADQLARGFRGEEARGG